MKSRISFKLKHKQPILRGEKTATLRCGDYDLSPGDELVAYTTDTDVEWAILEVTAEFKARADQCADILSALDEGHIATKTDQDVKDILQEYYIQQVKDSTTVQGICFKVTEKFAETYDR